MTSETGAMVRGRLIVFEGIDGSGISTQAKRLHEAFLASGINSHLTAEPQRDGPIGSLIRAWLRGEVRHLPWDAAALLFAADRMEHLHRVVVPLLQKGVTVICERYLFSNLAYQAAALSGVEAQIQAIRFILDANERALRADDTFFIQVPVDVAMERIVARGTPERFERSATLTLIKNLSEAILDDQSPFHPALEEATERWWTVDGVGTELEVHNRVVRSYILELAEAFTYSQHFVNDLEEESHG